MASRLIRWFQAAPVVFKQGAAAFLVRQLYGQLWRLLAVIAVLTLGMLASLVLLFESLRGFHVLQEQAWDYWATVLPYRWIMPLVFWSVAGPLAIRMVWSVSQKVAEATERVPPPELPDLRRLLASRMPVTRPIATFHAWERALIETAFAPKSISQARSMRLEAALPAVATVQHSPRL